MCIDCIKNSSKIKWEILRFLFAQRAPSPFGRLSHAGFTSLEAKFYNLKFSEVKKSTSTREEADLIDILETLFYILYFAGILSTILPTT